MILKAMFHDKDYMVTLRRQMRIYQVFTAVGALFIILDWAVVRNNSSLPEFAQGFAQGFYGGAGAGLVLCGAAFCLRTRRLMKNPDARRKAEISHTDEREQAILKAAMSSSFVALFGVSIVGCFVVLPFSFEAFAALFVLVLFTCVFFFASTSWYQKHM